MKKTMVGKKYGQLTVLWTDKKYALCRCDCGNEIHVWKCNLFGNTSSCGCIKRTQNGLSRIPEYNVWKNIIDRCTNPSCTSYENYGGRGITVCEKWRNSFQTFLEDMGTRPRPGYTIERKDNELGYFKDNCKWIPRGEQNWNTRKNHFLTFKGKTQHLSKWARECGMPVTTLMNRVNGLGWDIETALTKPRLKSYER